MTKGGHEMSDVNCPYCGAEQEICHDDGYGYEEDRMYEQQCSECEKVFAFTTAIIMTHESHRADCLNGEQHRFQPTATWPKERTKMKCQDCGESRPCNEEEMAAVLAD